MAGSPVRQELLLAVGIGSSARGQGERVGRLGHRDGNRATEGVKPGGS